MNYYKNNIKHVKGDTYSSALIVEGLGQALDSVYFTCRDSLKNDSTILFEKSLADGGITQVEYDEENDIRKYAVRIDPYDTRNLQAGTYFYDLQITVNTDVFTIMKGNFILEQDASRKGEPTEPEIIIQIKAQLDEINGEVINVTVFDKLDYLSETKGLIKDSLNNLGSEITDDNTFRNYASKIDDLYNEWPKVTDEGTTFTISNTKKGKMQLDVKGNTEQTTYTGKNLFDKDNANIMLALVDSTTLSPRASYRTLYIPITGGETYTISKISSTRFRVATTITTPEFNVSVDNYIQNDNATSITITTSSTANYLCVCYYIITETLTEQEILDSIQIEKGSTATDYEPYVGGNASPNPDYPQNIRVVSGDNTINIIGKNLLNLSNKIVGYGFDNVNNLIVSASNFDIYYIPVTSLLTYVSSVELGTSTGNIAYAYSNEIPTLNTSITDRATTDISILNNGTFTAPSNIRYLLIRINRDSQVLSNWQIEKGSTATDYEPYQNQTYPIYLGDIELCKIGNYQDYFYKDSDKWYLKKNIGKVNFNEITNIKSGPFAIYNSIPNIKYVSSNSQIGNGLAEKYKIRQGSGLTVYPNYFAIDVNRVNVNVGTDVDNASGLFYYELATPTSTEITDLELIEQLNSLENATSYNNITNIIAEYEEGNAPFIISASALMKGSE